MSGDGGGGGCGTAGGGSIYLALERSSLAPRSSEAAWPLLHPHLGDRGTRARLIKAGLLGAVARCR